MKKIIMLAIIAVTITTSTFATPIKDNVNNKVLTAFGSQFKGAREVSWSKADEYVKASFKMNEQVLFAYFSESGELIGVSRNLVTNQLPINLITDLKKVSANGWISELFEFAAGSETVYYAMVENADHKIQLKSDGYSKWTVYKKTKKS